MGQASYLTTIKKSGTATVMTSEAMTTNSTVASTFRITDSTKNVWDRSATNFIFRNNGTTIASGNVTIDHLFGKAVLGGAAGTKTVTGTYLPMTDIAGANSYTLAQSAELLDDTDFSSTGWRSRTPALKDVNLSVTRWSEVDVDFFALINTDVNVVVEVKPGSGTLAGRGFFRVSGDVRSGDVGGLEAADVTFDIDDNPGFAPVFSWSQQ